jgi:hypothetical protein
MVLLYKFCWSSRGNFAEYLSSSEKKFGKKAGHAGLYRLPIE